MRSLRGRGGVGEGGEQAGGDAGGDQGVALGRGADGLDEQVRACVLEQESSGAGPEGTRDVVIGVEGGDHHDRQRVVDVGAGEQAGGLDAVEVWHPDVEKADIGPEPTGEGDGLAAIGGLADHLDVGLAVEDGGQFYRDDVLEAALDGEVSSTGLAVNQVFLASALIYILLPTLMVVLSLVLRPRVNRVTNIAVSLLYTVSIIVACIGEQWAYYLLGSSVEAILLLAIARTAWKWPQRPQIAPQTSAATTPSYGGVGT